MKVVFRLILVFATVSSCGMGDKGAEKETFIHEYPAYVTASFMDGCVEESSSLDISQTIICSCLIEKIQKEYTFKEFEDLAEFQRDAEWDKYQKFRDQAVKECIQENSNK